MFQSWRLKLREAEEALQHGQLDEARQLLLNSELQVYLPGKRLSGRVASGLAERACQRAIQGDMSAAWRDLDAARSLVGVTAPLIAARQEIVAVAMADAESHLAANDPVQTIAVLEKLERHDVRDEPVRVLKQVARHLVSARHLARHGKFADAESQVAAAAALKPELPLSVELRRTYEQQMETHRRTTEALHAAMAKSNWTLAVGLADQLLEAAPDCTLARGARRKAWSKVGTSIRDSRCVSDSRVPAAAGKQSPAVGPHDIMSPVAIACPPIGRRFLLWVDGVGGYLVCLGDSIVLGQATPDNINTIEVPFLADLSRHHARVSRRGDGYVVEPLQTTRLNGQVIQDVTLLRDRDEIELAPSVRLRFRQPHALSASARFDYVSRHRTQPTSDGLLMMAESCVLGPNWQNHVFCRNWEKDVVLFQRDDALFCRAMDAIEIDGHLYDGRGQVSLNSRVVGDDFSISLEELS